MNARVVKWFVPCLLVVAGAWLFWHSKNPPVEKAAQQTASAAVHPASTAPAAPAGATVATNANQTGAVETNRFAYRLANTTKSIGELVNDRKAVLLENALIDTGSPLNFSIPKQLQAQGDPGAYIVQARGPINAAFRALLARAGAGIVAYIPNDAYLVRVSGAGANLLAAQPPVQSVIRYEPYYKISSTMSVAVQPRSSSAAFVGTNRAAGPSLLACAVKQLPLPAGTCLTLGLFSDGAAATEAQIEKLGGLIIGRDKSPFGPVLRVQPPADWVALAVLPGVQIVEPYRPRVHANDLSRATMGVAADTQVPTNYFGLSGSNVIVAVADTGIDTNHPDFSGSGKLRVIFNDPADGVDTDGHGTHVAGTIAGDGTMSTTVTNAQGSIMPATNGQFRGMAPLATLFSMNLNDPDQQLQESAAQAGALIQNDSWNYGGDNAYDLAAASYDAATRDAQAAVVGSQPMLFVFSAGNGGQLNRDNGGGGGGSDDGTGGNPDTIFSPATAKDVITVGALEQLRNITNIVTDANSNKSAVWQPETDSSSQVAAFSSRGNVGIGTEGQFGRYKPDVVAPGVFVISTRSTEWISNGYYNPTNDAVTTLSDLLKSASQTDPPLQFFVFNNAIEVDINATPGAGAPNVPLPISVWEGTDPYTANPDVTGTNNINIYSPLSPVNTIWQCVVTNTTANNLSYTLSVDVKSTNNYGNYYGVLSNLNDSIGPWYRYESGTSMAAAGVSGTLALMADYFINTLQITPSPALLKALLINGARPTGSYNFQVENPINYEGWGQVGLPDSLPVGLTNQLNAACASFFVDQSPTNALATGDSHSYLVTLDTNADDYAQYLPLQITLAWTDPPGDPAAALKLVNNLTLVVSNMDTGDTYFGNDIPAGSVYNNVWDTNSLAATNASDLEDSINNVQQVILPPLLAGSYTVTVMGREVNVNAVTAQTNSVVQDYALVIACGEGEVPTAITMTDNGIVSNPTNDQDITFVMTTNNTPLMNQIVGASSPLLGTNQISVGTNTIWTTNGLITLGMTNQWHFYVVTNPVSNPPDFTNAAFITFLSDTLSIPREGVFANSETNATRTEADIDLYVAGPNDPNAGALTNLDPGVIANCVNGINGDAVSLGRGGTEFVIYTNSKPGDVYVIGVKSEDRMAAEYDFIPIFTDIPFGQLNGNGDQVVNGLNVPVPIPNGSPAHPQSAYVFAIAPMEMQIERVVVTNTIAHQNFGNLVGVLSHNYNGAGQTGVTLNQHDEPASPLPPGPYTMVYDDSGQKDFRGSQTSDGPGSLNNFVGQEALGVWILTETDNALTQTGSVQRLTLLIQPHIPLTSGVTNTIPPLSWSYNYIDVPPGYTNLTVFGTNLPATSVPPLQMYLNVTNPPTFSNYLFEADLTNSPPGQPPYPAGVNPGNSISYGPPLQPARYWVGVYNPDPANSHEVYLLATLGGLLSPVPPTDFSASGPILPSDAVASDTIVISNTDLIASVNVGIVVAHPRISDLTFTLVSPLGQSILLMENRGGDDTNGAGSTFLYTNVLNSTATGGAAANTNYLAVDPNGGAVPITYNFYTVPDEMTVYDGTNAADFYIGSPTFLYDTGFTSNSPAGPGAQNTIPVTVTVNSQPGYTNIVIIMNQFGNSYATRGDAWTYTAGAAVTNYEYLMFTEDTNLTTLPIKYAVPPFSFAEVASNYTLCDFELATNGNYVGPTNIYDAFGGWFVPTNRPVGTNLVMWTNNMVSVVTDPRDSIGDNVGTNFLALGDGTITRSIPTIPGRLYSVTFWYRGPGIAGWWRGEGNADDSSQPEGGNNGLLIGSFDFPAGEVGQAFEFEDAGQAMEFAGTNTYVQIRQSPALDVGTGGGLTVEGWINPTNLSQQMPLVEWLAKVPVFTNSADTNFSIVAGPFLDPATGHYYYMLAATNWTTSEIWATNLGGHLVTIDTANEQNWVYDTFANYDATNRNLWIGLTNSYDGTKFTFGYSSGLTNVFYANWANGQPTNNCGTANYTFMLGSTNAPGLWTLANNNEVNCSGVIYSNIFGVVEVDNLQTNGVQFWISVTNTPGTNNPILDGAGNLYTNGCLYANLVDVSNVTHEIYSAAGLVQSNVYQHVALTYDTNSGVAMLYYNGTNVAITNLGVFVPKTGGDVLLGKDMSLATNGYYGGEMDEMSIYGRALSGAEIAAIYNVSAFSTNGFGNTNGLVGKFDPTVTPAYGLAEAQVAFGTTTNIIYGVNNQWELNSFTFTATSNAMPLQISGLEPGILLDDFAVSEMPLTNLYYLPEQSLDELDGNSPFGTWTLQIWDNRANAAVTAADARLINWELQFVLETNVLATALPMNPENPTTITVPPGQTVYLSVAVPSWAGFATNVLDSATGPVDLLFNPTNEPAGTNPGDQTLLTASTGGIGLPVLAVNSPFPLTLPNQAGQSYYLGVRNPGTHAVTAVVEADFDITGLSNSVPVCGILQTNDQERYFSFDVSSNAFEATFQLLDLSSNADLVVRKGSPLPTLFSSDYGSFNPTNADENIYVFTNSQPVPLSAGRWYLGVFKRDAGPVYYTILAKELDETNGTPGYAVIDLTNRVPFNFTAGPGAALTNFFRFNVANTVFLVTNAVNGMTNAVNGVTTNVLGSIHFELYNLSGNGDLTVQTDAPPFAPPFLESSQEPSRDPELITIRTNGVLTNLVAQWFLGVPNRETNLITYTIIAELDTNIVFPAFPGAEGAGADAVGGRFGNVYHVTSLADSGPGTLRDAVGAANRTVVFDLSGTIYLLSPLVITNSFLTIAGQTAPGGGITVAGNMTTFQSAHDVVIRVVRFRSGVAGGGQTNGFEGSIAADYTNGQVVANSGWTVLSNQVSLVTDSLNAYGGSNFLALANGVISNTLPTVAGTAYTLTFAYRGPGIVGWWRAENNTNDSINGNNPSAVQAITFASGEVGQAFHYDGSTSLIAVPASSSLPVSNLTVEAWVYPTDGSTARPIFDLGGPGQDSPVQLWINTTGGFSVNPGGLHAVIRNATSGVGYEIDDPNPVVVLNQWNHVVLTATPSTGTLYCNGVQVGTTTTTPLIPQSYADVDIGYRDTATGESFVTAGRRFLGNIDEASIYNRPLSASEIKAIYTNGSAGKFDPAIFSNSPALSLAEARICVDGPASAIVVKGSNTTWQVKTITFTATKHGTPVQISGVEPGMLLDSLSLATVVNADDALRLTNVSDIVADHISTSWSTNNLVSVLGSTNVTVQWSIMADSLTNNLHGYGSRLRYGNGALTFHHNLYADNYNASPRLGDDLQLDFVNNVVYNWGLNAGFSTNETLLDDPLGFTNELNYVGNYLIAGSNSVMTNIAFWSGTTNTWIYQTNNFMDSNTNGILDGADTGWFMFTNHYTPFQTPFPPLAVGIDEAYQAYERVLDFAGPAMDKRDAADTNIVSKVRTQTGTLVASAGMLPALNSTLPYLDTDQDGIPDFWEITFGTDPFTPSNNNLASDGSGYTDLEEYDNWLAGPHALTVTNTPAGVDLMQLFGKTGKLSFSVTNAVNGSVYLTNVLNYTNVLGAVSAVTNTGTFSNSFAIFTPTNDFGGGTNYGYASFDVYVTNNDTIAYFGPVTVSVVVSKVPVAVNSNFPPVIINLTNGISYSNANVGGSDFYHYSDYTVPTNGGTVGVLFEVTNASGPVTLIARYGLPLPSLSSYDYISANPGTADEHILVLTNSTPVFLTNGDWYLAVVNVSGGPVTYSVIATNLSSILAPLFVFPTNSTVTNIVETFPFTVSCLATDLNSPPLPLTFALVNGPTNMTVTAGGLISWTPTPAQSPSANLVSVSVSNGALTTTNTFKIFVSPIPSITQVSVTATNVVLQWSAPTNDLFEVDWATNLTPVVNWFPFTPPITSTDGTFTFTDTNLPLLIKFYRLRLLP
jgi:subtilisin-like proprotein convertase family protein